VDWGRVLYIPWNLFITEFFGGQFIYIQAAEEVIWPYA